MLYAKEASVFSGNYCSLIDNLFKAFLNSSDQLLKFPALIISRWWFDDEPEDLWRTQNVISFACFMLMSLHYFGRTACCPLTTDSRQLSVRIEIFLIGIFWRLRAEECLCGGNTIVSHHPIVCLRYMLLSVLCWKGSMSVVACYMLMSLQYSGGTAVLLRSAFKISCPNHFSVMIRWRAWRLVENPECDFVCMFYANEPSLFWGNCMLPFDDWFEAFVWENWYTVGPCWSVITHSEAAEKVEYWSCFEKKKKRISLYYP